MLQVEDNSTDNGLKTKMELEFFWILDNLQISEGTTYNKKKNTLKKEIIL